eukprot:TRINITY_DN12971_c0_g1_i1.p1 TRINITY_DN12971_c0_g1~~TRINITY_DN12971_c0_g1_i1.p1  ORF type:complete len:370 (-),score=33.13 TRINITY_DN12971_c0_g1_i1:144-1187(-)
MNLRGPVTTFCGIILAFILIEVFTIAVGTTGPFYISLDYLAHFLPPTLDFPELFPENQTSSALFFSSPIVQAITTAPTLNQHIEEHNSSRVGATIYFLHIQKTGGSTIRELVRLNEPRAVKAWIGWLNYTHLTTNDLVRYNQIQKKIDKAPVIMGHFLFGIERLTSSMIARYFTIVRNPTDRLVSLYYWHKHIMKEVDPKLISFRTFIMTERKRFLIDNHMTRVLCGPEAFFKSDGQLTSSDVLCATKNLKSMETILVLEEFRASMQLVEKVFGWKKLNPTNQKVVTSVTGGLNGSFISREDIGFIKRYIKYDHKVYQVAMNMFCQQTGTFQIPHETDLCEGENNAN